MEHTKSIWYWKL